MKFRMSCTSTKQNTLYCIKGILAGWLNLTHLERVLGSNPSRSMFFFFFFKFQGESSLLQQSAPICCSGDSVELIITSAKYARVDHLYHIYYYLSMALSLCEVAPCKAHTVIHFFTAQNKSAVEIHKEVCSVYGNCMSIQMIQQWCKYTSLRISTYDLLSVVKKTNNHVHLTRSNYTQQQCHFQCCVLYIFVKRLLHNFYSVARNSKITSFCNSTLIGSLNAEKKIEKQTFEYYGDCGTLLKVYSFSIAPTNSKTSA